MESYRHRFILLLFISVLCCPLTVAAQNGVGIFVDEIDDGSVLEIGGTSGALVPPRMTNQQMRAIPEVLDGTLIYNTTDDLYYYRSNEEWRLLEYPVVNTIILNRDGGSLPTVEDSFIDLPIGANHIIVANQKFYEVLGNGTIKVLRTGTYVINAELSVTNFPLTGKNFSLILNKNEELIGYLNRAYVRLERSFNGSPFDYFGATGTQIIDAVAGDVFQVQYNVDYNSTNLNVKFLNIGISKIL